MRRHWPHLLLAGLLAVLALLNLAAAVYRGGFGPGEIEVPGRVSAAEALYVIELATFLLLLPLAAAFVVVLLGAGGLALWRRSVPWRTLAAAGVLLAGVLVLGGLVPLAVRSLRVQGLRDAAEGMEPLVAAMARYEREHGARPERLDQLAPYVGDVKRFGVRGCRPLEYRTEYVPARWELHMDCPNGFITLDRFFYRPERNYERSEFNQRIGSWAYFWD